MVGSTSVPPRQESFEHAFKIDQAVHQHGQDRGAGDPTKPPEHQPVRKDLGNEIEISASCCRAKAEWFASILVVVIFILVGNGIAGSAAICPISKAKTPRPSGRYWRRRRARALPTIARGCDEADL